MMMTMLEARVAAEKWAALEQAFHEQESRMPAGLVHTFLVHSTADRDVWRLIGIWESRQAIEDMRRAGTPGGVLIFRAAGSEPVLSLFEISARGEAA